MERATMTTTQVWFEDVGPGTELPELVKHCSPRQLVMWAAASHDFYEIHYDADHARSTGLPGLVIHGALKHAFLGQLLHDWVAPKGRVVRFGCSYRGMDEPGRDLRCRGRVTRVFEEDDEHRAELEVWVEDDRGRVTTPGDAVVALPRREEALR
jgi:acyl dehydratase